MVINTQQFPRPRTIAAVRELIAINVDSYNSYTHAVNCTDESALRDVFSDLAHDRIRQAVELNQLILTVSGRRNWEPTIAGRIHRAIMNWEDKFEDGPTAVLAEAVRGEVYIRSKYESALSSIAQENVLAVLNRHYRFVQRAHDRMESLYDKYSRRS